MVSNNIKRTIMKNWKTTAAGAAVAIGQYLITVTEPAWLHTVGNVMVTLGSIALGYFAKDSNVTGGTTPQ